MHLFHRFKIVLLLILVFSYTAPASAKDDTITSFIARSKQEATRSFLDPDSGKFRNLYVTKDNTGLSLCGEINGKNSYGGYVGYRRFIQHFDVAKNSYEKVNVEPDQPKDEMEKIKSDVFTVFWDLLCESMPAIWHEPL